MVRQGFSEGSWCPARGSTHTGRPTERSPLLSKSRAAHIPARVVSSIARRSFIIRRMSDQTSCCAPGGLPTAGQRYGRERRPARRVPVTDLLMQLDFRQVTRVEQSMEVPPSVFDWKDWAAPMLAQ